MQPAAAPAGAPLEAPATRSMLARLDLPATLLVLAAFELLLHRWGARVFFPGLLFSLSPAAHALTLAGRFAFNATAVLAVVTLVYLCAAIITRRELYPAWLRLPWAVAGLYIASAVGASLVLKGLPEGLMLHARGGLVAFAGFTLLGVFLGPGESRSKVGVLCLIMPVWFVSYAAFAVRFPAVAPHADLSGWPTHALRLGESGVIAAAIISFLCFMPPARARRGGGFGPLLLACAITVGIAVVSAQRFDLTVRASIFAVGIDLPFPAGLRALYLCALFSITLTILALIAAAGPARAAGLGLALFIIAGYQGQHPAHLGLAACGLATLALGLALGPGDRAAAAEGAPIAIGDGAWRGYVAALKAALTPPDGPPAEAVIVDGDEGTITRVRGLRRGRPVTVKGIGRGGLVSELEVAVGVTAEGPPALSLHPRVFGAGRLGPVAAGGLVQPTGDPAFDQRYRLRGRAAAVDLLDPGLRERLEEVWGWLGVWTNPGGARFRTAGRPAVIAALLPAASVAAGDPGAVEPLLRLCDLVCDVADRAR